MKKYLALLSVLCLAVICGCGEKRENTEPEPTVENTMESTTVDIIIEPLTDEELENLEYSIDFHTAWSDLLMWCGELPERPLTHIEKRLVLYPKLDPSALYYREDGASYQSVRWGYTLDNITNVRVCNIKKAVEMGLQPCDKCVKPIDIE